MLGYVAKGNQVAAEIKNANELTLNRKIILDYLGVNNIITRILKGENGKWK